MTGPLNMFNPLTAGISSLSAVAVAGPDGIECQKLLNRALHVTCEIRDIDRESITLIHAMNEEALPHVNSVTTAYLLAQVSNGSYFRAAYAGDEPAAFLLAMDETADYGSLNFLWFKRHYPRFVYIDRVVVGPGHRRSGLGRELYADLERWARDRAPRLTCDVNLRPANEPSMRFHEGLGFEPVGSQNTEGGTKTVSLMVKEL